MSLFQCEKCGCVENTACTSLSWRPELYNWSGMEEFKGKELCCVCSPLKYRDGNDTGHGVWHNRFKRCFLPKGMFKTNAVGNLEHIENGDCNFAEYEIEAPE